MRVIFVINNTYPNGRASSARVREYGKGFCANGVETIVLIPQPRTPRNAVDINPEASGIDANGVKYYAMAGSQKRKGNLILRQFFDFWGQLRTLIWLIVNLNQGDKVIVYEGKNRWIKQVLYVCRLRGAKVGFELNELPFGTGDETQKAQNERDYMLKHIFPRFDFFLCISQGLMELAQKHSNNAVVLKVPIISEGQLIGDDFPEMKTPYIFHSGTLTEQKDGICGMIEAFGIAKNKINGPLQFILTGNITDSPHKSEIEYLIYKYSIEDSVKFIGYLETPVLRKYQKNCLMVIINKYPNQQNNYCFSTKLSEYLSFSRPVITTTVGEANFYLKDGVNACVVQPHDPKLIADKIIYIYNYPEDSKRLGEEAHKLTLKEFDCCYQTKKIINSLMEF